MLDRAAFANSLAILSAAIYLVFHLIRLIAPIGFRFVFNAQFIGADVASLLWREIPVGTFVISFIIAVATAWIFAYGWAWLYNRLAK
jgi:2TM family of unknown function (DUF5676)